MSIQTQSWSKYYVMSLASIPRRMVEIVIIRLSPSAASRRRKPLTQWPIAVSEILVEAQPVS
jgi:hypothetical protein